MLVDGKAAIGTRINPQIKADTESLYANLGTILTEAGNIFPYKSILKGRLPSDARQP